MSAVRVAGVEFVVDRDRCIGAGMCVLAAEDVFDQDDDGVVVVREPDGPVDPDAVERAVAGCPSGALRAADG